jgi:nitroreductase / dihydropteridine reductase
MPSGPVQRRKSASHGPWRCCKPNLARSATLSDLVNTASPENRGLQSDTLLERLHWRYATKKMDPTKAVPQNKVERILEAARLAPTSSGLQPYEIIVVTSPAVRERIKPIAWNQGQITDGSHLLVFAAWDNYTAERINMMFDLTNTVRGFKNEGWEDYRHKLGYREADKDWLVNLTKVRRPRNQFITEV